MSVTGTHDAFLVNLSILIAMFASFTALSLAGRVRASTGWARGTWLAAASLALGGGIWAMHFVAMLALSMPGMEMDYDLPLTILSLGIALLFTGAGFAVMNWERVSRIRVVVAGLLMGSGVVTMHYVGMAAMRMPATLSYERTWLAASVLIAIGAATAAVWLASRDHNVWHRLVAAVVMGFAIAGMHYAGMRAAVFTATHATDLAQGSTSIGQTYLAFIISGVTVLILLMALGAARIERLFQGLARRESRVTLRLHVADVLRGRETGEALREVAGLMGRHFGVARTGFGQLDPAEDIFDFDICWTNGSVPPLLGRLPATAFGVKIVQRLTGGETVVINDLLASKISDEPRTRQTARDVQTRAILVVPFVRDGRLSTIVYLNDSKPRRWSREDVAFMEEMAERIRLVIERAAVEEQLRDLNATLEARVEARTSELEQTQRALLQSQKMEAVGQLVSGLAHDFNNVLGAIMGNFDLVKRRAEDPERVRRLAQAGAQATRRGAKLTAQLLAFSRSQKIELQSLYVCDVIEDVRDLLAKTLGPLNRLDMRLNPDPVPVLADATQVEMMVLNLTINARDAMPDGGTLTISTMPRQVEGDPELPDGDYVELSVADTGTGMDEETLRRAMEPFFTTKPLGRGTGLGLSQIYGSARQGGGTVRIDSVKGVGTTVRVLLPRTDLPVAVKAMPGASTTQNSTRGSIHILLVDDDHDVRAALADGLEAQGHRVTQASDGTAALFAMKTETPEVVVADFAMPGMNGAELARLIAERWPELPVIFASGYADTGAIEVATGGKAMMLRKPFDIDDLLHAIDTTLR